MCAPMLDRVVGLPGPQRQALEIMFGLSAEPPPDRFLIGLAVLSLLSEVAEERPLVCVVDDAQWLDEASALTLGFVARRLGADSIALLFAAREPGEDLRGLPELAVEGLGNVDARAQLSSALRFVLDERVRDRIVADTRGNPLALLELPRGLTASQLAGGFGLLAPQELSGRIGASFQQRLAALPFQQRLAALPLDTQRFLTVAAAEPVGDPVLVWGAAQRLGIAVSAATAAENEGLMTIGERVTFRHPLVRSAAYRAAPAGARREVHLALAEVTDYRVDPDRRAWHLAAAAAGPDEEVASELERSAGRAKSRGGLAAAAAFHERAAELTEDPARRADRALAAAQVSLQAGAFEAARGQLALAEAGSLEELQQARIDLLRGQIAFVSRLGNDAPATPAEGRQAARVARSRTRTRNLSERLGCGRLRQACGRGLPTGDLPRGQSAPATAGAFTPRGRTPARTRAAHHRRAGCRGTDPAAGREDLYQRRDLRRSTPPMGLVGDNGQQRHVGRRRHAGNHRSANPACPRHWSPGGARVPPGRARRGHRLERRLRGSICTDRGG